MTASADQGTKEIDLNRPMTVVSCDSHIGPRLVEELRPYCPKKYLEDFDAFILQSNAQMMDMMTMMGGGEMSPTFAEDMQDLLQRIMANCQSAGHYDMNARLRDMDEDGVAAEIIVHGSSNGAPVPFVPAPSDLLFNPTLDHDLERAAIGVHIFSSWLADACKTAPERLLGTASLPMWDIDLAVKEVAWAKKAGLKGVVLPAPRPGIKAYDYADWDPFWSACEEYEMPLCAHAGSAPQDIHGVHSNCIVAIELAGWAARSGLPRMVFGGVFERHPKLKLVLTETNFDWWVSTMAEFDSSYAANYKLLRHTLPKKPSEYCRANVFIGASFIAPFEVKDAVEHDYVDNVIWGRDYPHIEGSWVYREEHDRETNPTRLHWRFAFGHESPDVARKILSDNGLRVYGLDRETLDAIGAKIGPTLTEVTTPLAEIPKVGGWQAFREIGPWG